VRPRIQLAPMAVDAFVALVHDIAASHATVPLST
jgi:hypothetical protein